MLQEASAFCLEILGTEFGEFGSPFVIVIFGFIAFCCYRFFLAPFFGSGGSYSVGASDTVGKTIQKTNKRDY